MPYLAQILESIMKGGAERSAEFSYYFHPRFGSFLTCGLCLCLCPLKSGKEAWLGVGGLRDGRLWR